jgi:hypothetical protein
VSPLIILAFIAGIPIVLAILLRVSSVFVFFSVAAGALLVTSIGDDVAFALNTLFKGANAANIINLTLLCLPVALTLYFLRKSMPRAQLLLHILPLVAAGLMLATIAMPEMSLGVQGAIKNTEIGDIFYQAGDLIIAIAAVLNLLLAWTIYRFRPAHHHKKHKK